MATGASRCFQISAANVLLGVAICFCISHRSCAGDGLLAPAFTRLLLGVIMCAGSGSPTGVHEFVLYRHSSLSQSRHSEGREPCCDGVDFRGLLFIAERGFWAAKVESLSVSHPRSMLIQLHLLSHCNVTFQALIITLSLRGAYTDHDCRAELKGH